MFFGDIPIWLINSALWALVAMPFVAVGCTLYLAQKLVKPGWALYWLERERIEAARPTLPPPPPRVSDEPVPHRRVKLSAFGR